MQIDRQEIPSIVSRTELAAGHIAGVCDDLLDALREHDGRAVVPPVGSCAMWEG